METSKVSAVLAVYQGLERTKKFLYDLVLRFPDIPVVVSCVGDSKENQDGLRIYVDELVFSFNRKIKLVRGSYDKRVSFSENWNAAINAVETERLVLLHNDMYLHDEFFAWLNRDLDQEKQFVLYTTVEPFGTQGFVRPGKIVADFGDDLEDFKREKFEEFAKRHIESHRAEPLQYGYGFYLAGFLKDFQDVGGFDQTRYIPCFCEDDDINLRIRLKGYQVRISETALVYHFSAKTTSTMKKGELDSNRTFARKWGVEARFLWKTGYEWRKETPDIGTETIGFEGIETESALNLINAEPLVDYVTAVPDKATMKTVFANVQQEFWDKFVKKLPDVDIVIRQVGPFTFKQFADLVGTLRFTHSRLSPGKVAVGPFVVEVVRVRNERREDTENYLSLQKNTKYE